MGCNSQTHSCFAERKAITSDCHVTYDKTKTSLSISRTLRAFNFAWSLKSKKVFSWWIPQNLSRAQNDSRVKWCLGRAKKNSTWVTSKHVIGDKTWIFISVNLKEKNNWLFGCFPMTLTDKSCSFKKCFQKNYGFLFW